MSRAGLGSAVAALALAAASLLVWSGGAGSAAGSTAGGMALDGADLFRAKGCAGCHAGPDGGGQSGVGPSLLHASAWAGGRRSSLSAEAYLAESIREPWAFNALAAGSGGPGPAMPALGLTEGEIAALVAYLLQS